MPPSPDPFRHLARALLVIAASIIPCALGADPRVQDGIDRSLRERGARAFELQMGLEPAPPPAPLPETEVRRSVALPPPIGEIYERPRPDRAPSPAAPDVGGRGESSHAASTLIESQRRRQLGAQVQTRQLPTVQRRQALDAQQLQFERELQAERLRSEIMRNSERALRR